MTKLLVVMAMPEESQGRLEAAGADIVYTGLGKVNAAYALASAIYRQRANGAEALRILNLGTAGSHSLPSASLVECTRFVQHDMDASPIGFPIGTTPFEKDLPPMLVVHKGASGLPEATCHSGDRFITQRGEPAMEVIDMEAYALAKVCLRENVAFSCIKFISDGADGQAASDWQDTLERASIALAQAYARLSA